MTSLIGFSEKEQVIGGWSALEIFKLSIEAPLYLPVLDNFLSKDEDIYHAGRTKIHKISTAPEIFWGGFPN